MHLVADLKAFLAGSWRIDRRLIDRRNAIDGNMTGEAHFCPDADALLYREHGSIAFGAHQGTAGQEHRYEFPDGNRRASICFHDGRPFHELDLSRGFAEVSHACGDDLYEGRFIALDEGRWESRWTVAGPRKDQWISTVYTRMA